MQLSKSQLAILKSGKSLFWKYGIRRVTVEDICKEAGVSKMTFYRGFENKDEVARKVLKQESEASMNKYRTIMSDPIDTYPQKITKLIALEQENSLDVSQEFISDIYQKNESDLKNYLELYKKDFQDEMIGDFKKAQENGWIRKDIKMDFILMVMNLMNEKMTDEAFLSLYDNSHDAIMELTNFFFYGIFPSNTKEE